MELHFCICILFGCLLTEFWVGGEFPSQGSNRKTRDIMHTKPAAPTFRNSRVGWRLGWAFQYQEKRRPADALPPTTDDFTVFINGLSLDGAAWDRTNGALVEPAAKV